ncbi:MAG: hypothetical protein WEC15_04970 [Flavobacteriales bacterium]
MLSILATAAFGWAMGLWLPFWSLSLSAMLVGFILHPGGWKAFVAGLLAGLLLWGGLAYTADAANGQLLSTRVGRIFGTEAGSMVLITAVLGGLLAGLGTLLGDRVRNAVS